MPNAVLVSNALHVHVAGRLPYALKKAGFGVWIVCPNQSLMRYSEYIDGGRAYNGSIDISVLGSLLREVCSECSADAIVACDEQATQNLDVIREHTRGNPAFEQVRSLLDVWQSSAHSVAAKRSSFVESVRALGIRTPRQVRILPNVTQPAELAQLGSPIVLKRDHTAGGTGVSLASTPQEAIDNASQAGADRPDSFPKGAVAAQELIRGQPASVSFSASRGELLEAFAYLSVRNNPAPFGPATVIRIVEHPGLIATTRQIVAHLGYTGFGGVDFMLPSDGGDPVFLEMNARPTQTIHLGSLFGADLCRALSCALTGENYTSAFDISTMSPIALFPSEWIRDRLSPHLQRDFHDVPWHERRITALTIAVTPELNQGIR